MTTKATAETTPQDSCVFTVGEHAYCAPRPGSVKDLPLSRMKDLGLVTVFALPKDSATEVSIDWVRAELLEYEEVDDVFNRAFLDTVIFRGKTANNVLSGEARKYLNQLGNRRVLFTSYPSLLPGPYVHIEAELRDVWRLINDANGTCMATLEPQSDPSERFEPFKIRSFDDQFPCFALRSRIKTRALSNAPLAGLRIVVKDNIHLKGLKTSVGNRAFYDLYPPRTQSAESLQKLVKQGVVVVGTTKMTSFANWEEPVEYIDYQAPWNPRADKYQSPGGSSSGSAAAITAYDWLDVAIGTDTWASITRPALWCGCFGLRPTFGAVSSSGVEPFCQEFDTPGILTRDLQKCGNFAAEWLAADALERDPKPFSSVIWPTDFWTIIDSDQTWKARRLFEMMGSKLGLDCVEVSFRDSWAKDPPVEAKGLPLEEYMQKAPAAQCYDAYHNLQDFREKYWQLYNHAPYVSPSIQKMWSFAQTITKEDRDIEFEKIDIYRKWFQYTILSGTSSNPLIILPVESMCARYRDQSPTFKRPPQDGISALGLGPVMKSPVLTVPFAQINFNSKVTGQEERLPFAIAIMSNPGTDLALIETTLQMLKAAQLPTVLKVGKTIY